MELISHPNSEEIKKGVLFWKLADNIHSQYILWIKEKKTSFTSVRLSDLVNP